MTLQQAYLLSGIIAAISVVASLLYMAAQIRQNTMAVRMSTGQAVTEELRALYRYSAEHDSADVVYRGFQDMAKLEGSDRLRFYAMMHDYFWAFQNAFFQMSSGTLDTRYWSAAVNSLRHLMTFPGVRAYWGERDFYYADDFKAFMKNDILTAAPGKAYNLAGDSLTGRA